jgi:hypothetical protein
MPAMKPCDHMARPMPGQVNFNAKRSLDGKWSLHGLILPPLQNLSVIQSSHVIRNACTGDQ